MITNRDATATKTSGMTETTLTAILAELGYNDGAIETYIADAKRAGVANLLGLETVRYNRNSGKYSIVIPEVPEETE